MCVVCGVVRGGGVITHHYSALEISPPPKKKNNDRNNLKCIVKVNFKVFYRPTNSLYLIFDTDRALYWNLPASLVFTTLLVYVGLVLFARYGDNDPVGCVIHRRDQVKCLYSPIMCAKLNGSLNEQKSNNLLSLMKIERNKIVLI